MREPSLKLCSVGAFFEKTPVSAGRNGSIQRKQWAGELKRRHFRRRCGQNCTASANFRLLLPTREQRRETPDFALKDCASADGRCAGCGTDRMAHSPCSSGERSNALDRHSPQILRRGSGQRVRGKRSTTKTVRTHEHFSGSRQREN
jgi:hypothetical protein